MDILPAMSKMEMGRASINPSDEQLLIIAVIPYFLALRASARPRRSRGDLSCVIPHTEREGAAFSISLSLAEESARRRQEHSTARFRRRSGCFRCYEQNARFGNLSERWLIGESPPPRALAFSSSSTRRRRRYCTAWNLCKASSRR